ncbi:MAG: hypothetical protein KGL93_04340, partial [Gemmatimonadota bacterium]|nr:hypothetical protein [Gemmatimonadota bacterium]
SARHRADPGESVPNLYLFTMGTPLRQLYSEAFPHLYSWVRGTSGPWHEPLPVASGAYGTSLAERGAATAGGPAPNPLDVGLARWVNAYRSGDYVGRELWRSARDPLYDPAAGQWSDAARTRTEFCIGAGAHTHYWDKTARAIAVELDAIVSEAMRR